MESIMKVTDDRELNAVYIQLKEDKNGVIIDYVADGPVAGIEVLNSSEKLAFPVRMDYAEV